MNAPDLSDLDVQPVLGGCFDRSGSKKSLFQPGVEFSRSERGRMSAPDLSDLDSIPGPVVASCR